MKSRDELAREVEVLGERITTLSAAVLRLGSSLDLATVLQEALPALTRAMMSAARWRACSALSTGGAPP